MPPVCDNVLDMIGNTPLVHLRSLSQATRCRILAKAEFSNPGGSSKDRVAAAMVQEAEASGALARGGTLVEATSGSTGVSLALVARARGYGCLLVVPDDTSGEKLAMMRALGAEVEVVKPAPIASDENAVNVARRRAKERPGSVFCDQFENLANMRAHERGTGHEIWEQTGGEIDAFVMSAGTAACGTWPLRSATDRHTGFLGRSAGSGPLSTLSRSHGATHQLSEAATPPPGCAKVGRAKVAECCGLQHNTQARAARSLASRATSRPGGPRCVWCSSIPRALLSITAGLQGHGYWVIAPPLASPASCGGLSRPLPAPRTLGEPPSRAGPNGRLRCGRETRPRSPTPPPLAH